MSKRAADDQLQAAQKRFKPDFQDVIEVLVGEDEVPFKPHTRSICDMSDYFKAACSKRWREGQDGLIKLPTVQPHVYKAYLNWVYTGKIDTDLFEHPFFDPNSHPPSFKIWSALSICCRLYVAADMFLDEAAKTEIINVLIEKDRAREVFLDATTVQYIWEHAPRGCALQRWYLDIYAATETAEGLKKYENKLPAAFVFDLAMRQVDLRGRDPRAYDPANLKVDVCYYHDHGDKKRDTYVPCKAPGGKTSSQAAKGKVSAWLEKLQ